MENSGSIEEPPDLFSVRGRSAIVTGASSGIGREIALALAQRGCNVVVAARRKDKLEELCHEIETLAKSGGGNPPGRALALELDVAGKEREVDAAVQVAWDAFGGLDIVINNAGIRGTKCEVIEIHEDEWDSVFAINVRGPWIVTKTISKRMIASGRRGCSIINVASISGIERGLLGGAAAYSASKAAVIRLTSACAVELGNYGIRCNAIAPGLFTSEITQDLMKKPYMTRNAELLVPMQRWGSANPDLTSLVIWMACDSSSYMNGACIIVDGGQSLRRERIKSKL